MKEETRESRSGVFRRPHLKPRIERAGGVEEQTGLDIMRNSVVKETGFHVLLLETGFTWSVL